MIQTLKDRKAEIRKLVKDIGVDAAVKQTGLARESIRRYMRKDKRTGETPSKDVVSKNNILEKISERFTKKELLCIAEGGIHNATHAIPKIETTKSTYRMGILSDTHLGSKYTSIDLIKTAFETFAQIGVDGIFVCGDVTEGMANRPGHVYELSHIGFESQSQHAIDVFSEWTDSQIYMIDGNHDRWYIKAVGANIVEHICKSLPNAEFLGHDEGDLTIGSAKVKLWHGEDGSSYAISYRIQKVVESLTGGEKPHILICGHTHKAMYVFDRHIHCLSAGAIQSQSKWMRAKRHASHTGFWHADIGIGKTGVTYFSPTWHPAYI